MTSQGNVKNRKIAVIVAAALIALLAVAAAAVVAGNARFKDGLTAQGADEIAALVQEPHMAAEADGEADGFALTIDEIIWEDDQLYFSYTARVPDDGNRYLMALYTPMLNGDPMIFRSTGWEMEQFFDSTEYQYAVPMGGKYPAETGQLLTFQVDPALREKAPNALTLRFKVSDMLLCLADEGAQLSIRLNMMRRHQAHLLIVPVELCRLYAHLRGERTAARLLYLGAGQSGNARDQEEQQGHPDLAGAVGGVHRMRDLLLQLQQRETLGTIRQVGVGDVEEPDILTMRL